MIGLTGPSGSGKTTLLLALLPLLKAQGLVVNAIKHSHHDVRLEPPEKDSARLRAAGAQEVLLASPRRWMIARETDPAAPPDLPTLLARLAPADITLVESWQEAPLPRIEIYRAALGQPPRWPQEGNIIAVASDTDLACPLPLLNLNNAASIAAFLLRWIKHERPPEL